MLIDVGRLESLVIGLFQQQSHWIPDEAADELDMPVVAIRPRFTELAREKRDHRGSLVRPALIRKTAFRRRNALGHEQFVYYWIPRAKPD